MGCGTSVGCTLNNESPTELKNQQSRTDRLHTIVEKGLEIVNPVTTKPSSHSERKHLITEEIQMTVDEDNPCFVRESEKVNEHVNIISSKHSEIIKQYDISGTAVDETHEIMRKQLAEPMAPIKCSDHCIYRQNIPMKHSVNSGRHTAEPQQTKETRRTIASNRNFGDDDIQYNETYHQQTIKKSENVVSKEVDVAESFFEIPDLNHGTSQSYDVSCLGSSWGANKQISSATGILSSLQYHRIELLNPTLVVTGNEDIDNDFEMPEEQVAEEAGTAIHQSVVCGMYEENVNSDDEYGYGLPIEPGTQVQTHPPTTSKGFKVPPPNFLKKRYHELSNNFSSIEDGSQNDTVNAMNIDELMRIVDRKASKGPKSMELVKPTTKILDGFHGIAEEVRHGNCEVSTGTIISPEQYFTPTINPDRDRLNISTSTSTTTSTSTSDLSSNSSDEKWRPNGAKLALARLRKKLKNEKNK